MFALADYYAQQGTPHYDYNKMMFWLRKAAAAGHPQAQMFLRGGGG
jgi:TPR repeat protein